ncbi:DUF5103 domain-containing protein [Rhodohalobacter sp. SW132]|uniref:type IX secretion system plug protein n=1 Tax=Rhodohalobacter sp. SW132 TaxID=2293433 RepID=UPI000E23A5F8|nr:type IX secretion system plug protein domain-containing protein [Rhodohalobacter sp. SW132]REL38282.1 DUF5103 domain-containing protein [Rhodohalobacter sp. SW132]
MKDDTFFKLFCLFLLSIAVTACGTSENGSRDQGAAASEYSQPENLFTVPGQMNASDLVYSVRLNRAGSINAAPVIRLNSSQQLSLNFDLLEYNSRQLRITFTHHNPDWSQSGLAEDFFKDGYFSLNIPTGRLSRAERPTYRQYSYNFPNDDIQFLVSGNYMLQVEDADSGDFMFSMPFFITENEGSIRSQVETRTVPRQDGRISHRPRSVFELPDFVTTPQFDLEFYYIQNQFWGRARQAQELDTSTQGEVLFEMRQENSFTGDYEFQQLDLTDLTLQAPQILEYNPTEIPPRVLLFDDVQGFSASRTRLPGSRLTNPDTDLSARYANVHFRFQPDSRISQNSTIYLVGDFNNWAIQSDYRLRYHPETDRWRTNGFIKTGTYAYKYLLIENNQINDLALDDSFTRTEQEYHAFVYYRDPNRFYYRLLQTNNFFENS